MEDDSILLTDLLAQLRDEGLALSQDAFQRLVDGGYIKKTNRRKAARKYEIKKSEAERLRQILKLRAALGPQTPNSELAFWMAAINMPRAPLHEAAVYIEDGVQNFFSVGKRMLARLGKGRAEEKSGSQRPTEERMASLLMRRFTLPPETPRGARDALELLVALVIAIAYLKKPPSQCASLIRRILYLVLNEPQNADISLPYWIDFLTRHASTFGFDKDGNNLVLAVRRAAKANPMAIRFAAQDAFRAVSVLSSAFKSVPDVPYTLKPTDQIFANRMQRSFVPILAAMSIDMQESENGRFLLERFRKGDDFGLATFIKSTARAPEDATF